jgi:rubrerythrin
MTLPNKMRRETTSEAEAGDQERYACQDCGTPFETNPAICSNCGSGDITDLTEVLDPDFRD